MVTNGGNVMVVGAASTLGGRTRIQGGMQSAAPFGSVQMIGSTYTIDSFVDGAGEQSLWGQVPRAPVSGSKPTTTGFRLYIQSGHPLDIQRPPVAARRTDPSAAKISIR